MAGIGRSCWGHSGKQKSCALAEEFSHASTLSSHCQSTAQAQDGQIWFLKKYQSLGFACRLLTFYFWFKLKPNKHCCWCQIKWHSCLRLLSRPLFWPFALAARWKSCRQRGSPGKWERKIETLVEDLCGLCSGFTVEDLNCESGRVLQCQWQKLACNTRPRMNHALHAPSVLDYSHFIKQGRGRNNDCEGCVSHPDCLREHSIAWRIITTLMRILLPGMSIPSGRVLTDYEITQYFLYFREDVLNLDHEIWT